MTIEWIDQNYRWRLESHGCYHSVANLICSSELKLEVPTIGYEPMSILNFQSEVCISVSRLSIFKGYVRVPVQIQTIHIINRTNVQTFCCLVAAMYLNQRSQIKRE